MKSTLMLLALAITGCAFGAEVEVKMIKKDLPDLGDFPERLETKVKDFWVKASDYLVYDGYTPPSSIEMTLDGTCKDMISSSQEKYKVCMKEYQEGKSWPDMNTIVQCTSWSVMHYPSGDPIAPDWLTQCVSAYMRFYHYEETKRASRPPKRDQSPKQTSTEGCAYWLNWVQENYPREPTLVQQIFKITREDKYNDKVFKDITGKSGKELWDEMQKGAKGKSRRNQMPKMFRPIPIELRKG